MKKEKLIDLFFKIQEKNPSAIISGSLGLNLCGISTRNEPQDLDILLPYGKDLNILEGFEEIDLEYYPPIDYHLTQYLYDGFKIDFFQPLSKKVIARNPKFINNKLVEILEPKDILKFKVDFAFDSESDSVKREKQIKDLGFIFSNLK